MTAPALSPLDTVLLEREAADVLRYHTQRTLRQQSIGAHSFGVMQLVLAADPECRKEVLVAAMRHDYAELSTGDVPAPAKRASAALQGALDDLERAHPHLAPHPGPFTSRELRILKWADTMELVLWCLEEHEMGNTLVDKVATLGMTWIRASAERCQEYCTPAARTITHQVIERMESLGLRSVQ